MATDVSDAFIKDYVADLVHVFQRRGAYLMPAVRVRTGVVGQTTTFQVIGKGTASTKARHGDVTPMNQTHTPATATLSDFYAGDYVDALDEAKLNIDERKAIAEGGAFALGRKVDEQILAALDGTTQTVINIDESTYASYLASALQWTEALSSNDVPNDGQRYAVVTPRLHTQLSTINAFASSDFVNSNGTPFNVGEPSLDKWRDWQNVKWKQHSDTTTMGVGTATAKNFLWHKSACGYATAKYVVPKGNFVVGAGGNAMVAADIQWIGPKAAHWVNHMMSGGAVLIDDTGVIEASHDDTQAVVTS
jgi:hypothetical protein